MIGKIISHYHILEKLGEGGMGVVYKAHDTSLDRDVALKFLPYYLTSDPIEKERFYHEARAAAALTHQNIAVVYEIGEHDHQIFIAMEYVEGRTLTQFIEKEPPSIKKVIDITIQICEGLAAAHEKGIVHRDIKPENIIITPKGQAKITDFGLAKLKGTTKLTKAGSTLGTAAYMSPEQAQGEEVDHRSDIFSFGVVLYELLTGKLPFRGEHHAALMYSIMIEEPQPIARFNEKVTPEIERIVYKALVKDKDERYQHVDDLLADLRHERKKLESAKADQVPAAVPSIEPTSVSRRPKMIITLGVVALLLFAAVIVYLFYPKSPPTTTIRKTVAVLPFKNLSDSKEDEYFSDGLTEDIITQLSKISALEKVIARTSVMRYKQTAKSIRDIGKELDVATVLEGSVRRAGNHVRIVAQLIDAQSQGHIWAETYDKELTQIFEIQTDVSQRIADALRAKLTPEEERRIGKKQTGNAEAYQLFLKGRFHWNKRTLANHRTAIDYFTKAIESDPHYALAYAGLASTYVLLPEYGVPTEEAIPKAESAARKALELDDELAEPHAVIGTIRSSYEWNWAVAESEFKKAIRLDVNNPTAHQWYSRVLIPLGRFDEALSEVKYAQELDPLSMIINMAIGMTLVAMRQYDQAEDHLMKNIELDPNFPWNYLYLATVHEAQGNYDQAIDHYRKAISLAGGDLEALAYLGYVYAKVGRRTDASKALAELLEYSRTGHSVSYDIALVYNGMGEKDEMFAWLEKAFLDRHYNLTDVKIYHYWDKHRSEPRFMALMKKMGLEK